VTAFTDIASDAFAKIGVYAPGETITAADMQTAFNCFNDMLDNWSNQSLAAYANVDNSVVLTPNKATYTIGSGGDISVSRPISMNMAPGSAYVVDLNGNVYPVTVIDQAAWNSISSRNVTGTWPEWIFYDPQFPLGILNVWPTPTAGYTLHFTSRIPFVEAATETSTISLPPGYSIALKYNLGVELIPYFPEQSKDSAAVVIKRARDTLGDLKRINAKIPLATFDSTMRGVGRPYNIYLDR
jgi:hypothetical protein